jgi:hypothetical protein
LKVLCEAPLPTTPTPRADDDGLARLEDAHRCALERPVGEYGRAAGDNVATREGEEAVVAGLGVSAGEGLGGAGAVNGAMGGGGGRARGGGGRAGAERAAEMTAIQHQYAADLLQRAGMAECHPMATPVDTQAKLSATDGAPVADATQYRSLAGALQYLTLTRPDLAYAVQQVCLFMHDPHEPHLALLKRVLRYVKGTLSTGLHIGTGSITSLSAYSDADWAGCPDSRRSTSEYCVFLGDNLVSWSSKRQTTVSRSSVEAEYRAVAHAVAETCWLRQLLQELHAPISSATIVFCDNVSAVYMTANPVHHRRTKHIEIDIHFVCEKVALGQVRVFRVPSSLQFADIMTKGYLYGYLLILGPVSVFVTLPIRLREGVGM